MPTVFPTFPSYYQQKHLPKCAPPRTRVLVSCMLSLTMSAISLQSCKGTYIHWGFTKKIKKKVERLEKTVKSLRQTVRRQSKKINNMKDLIKNLKDNKLVSDMQHELLEQNFEGISKHLFQNQLSNLQMKTNTLTGTVSI